MEIPDLERLPLELVLWIANYLSPESKAALAMVSRSMREKCYDKYKDSFWYENLDKKERRAFLKLVERDTDQIYCPWCAKLHGAQKSIDSTSQPPYSCHFEQRFTADRLEAGPRVTASHHPNIIYAFAKNLREGRNVKLLRQMIEMTKVEKLQFSKMTKSHENVFEVNNLGIFWQQRDCYTTTGHVDMASQVAHYAEFKANLFVCQHIHPKAMLVDEVGKGSRISVDCGCHVPGHSNKELGKELSGQFHHCEECGIDFSLENGTSELGTNQLYVSTWRYIGPVDSPENLAPDFSYRKWRGLTSSVARSSGLPSAMNTVSLELFNTE
ncbi:hypothetical protein SCUP234_03944 [Seiridium cupressi]